MPLQPENACAPLAAPAARVWPLVPGAPRLTQARCELLREIQILDEYGDRRRIHIPAERPLTVYVDKREIVTLMTLVGFVVFVVQGPWPSKVLLALSAVVIAAFGNILRVASLLGVAYVWGGDAGFKYYHDYSGIVFFASALALLLLFSWLLGCREIREDIF